MVDQTTLTISSFFEIIFDYVGGIFRLMTSENIMDFMGLGLNFLDLLISIVVIVLLMRLFITKKV